MGLSALSDGTVGEGLEWRLCDEHPFPAFPGNNVEEVRH